jgi:serine/threonine-protein kinase HipA
MATLLIGKVFYQEEFAGYLREETGDRTSFTYDEKYLDSKFPSIAHTLPLLAEPFTSRAGLLPFFDNLVAEGWLEEAQKRWLDKKEPTRFELLLAFGQDCAGAVSIIDPEPQGLLQSVTNLDPKDMVIKSSRASVSGVQPKFTLIEREGKFYPTRVNELSTHIAKFPSRGHEEIIEIEYNTMLAFQALLPTDSVAKVHIGKVEGLSDQALIIKRFDRDAQGKRIHFEEFNQLLGNPSGAKYNGAYKDMADFIRTTKDCLPAENYRLYLRIIAGFLLGNTDMHLKNFAMYHTEEGLRLTPSYDQVAAFMYPQYNTLALSISGARDLEIGILKPKHIIALGREFQLSDAAIMMAYEQLKKNKEHAKNKIEKTSFAKKQQMIEMVEKRWNGTFDLIGKTLLKKL